MPDDHDSTNIYKHNQWCVQTNWIHVTSQLQINANTMVDQVRIVIRSTVALQDKLPQFERWLSASEQETILLRSLLKIYCAERNLDPTQYSLCLHHDILFSAATVDTLALEYNMPRTGELSITLIAVPLPPPCPRSEMHFGVRRMSCNSVYDHMIAFDALSRNNLGSIDKFALAAVVAQTESLLEREKYRHMCEDERHDKIIDSIRASPHFNSLMKDVPSLSSVPENPLERTTHSSSTIPSEFTPDDLECTSRDCEIDNDLRRYNKYYEDDDYNDNDDGVMDPILAEHMRVFMDQNAANIAYNV